ncbi:glycine--tRNA ligase subunit beta [Caviibacter abscessus]|uniref:glycine--tRNA ligase subunit beta n=1 Tax=Caviibacter abscessus TaxID=1766719 RepID=UPI0008372A24|nr:glycine--tRNA ligase subunit beta [Caviibacter abscessus]
MNFLFELGLEELPSRYVDTTEKELKNKILDKLVSNKISFDNAISFSTPRRIAIIINGLCEKQEDIKEVKLGPSLSVAIVDGKPTKALLGFLASNKVSENDYEIIDTPKDKYIQITKHIKGRETKEVLSEILKESIKELEFEKVMKWSDKQFRFVRPIKWIVSMLNDSVMDFEFEGIKASNITRGMRVFGSQEIVIDKMENYESILLENYVIADRNKREKALIESIEKNCNTSNEKTVISKKLLNEVVNLVEYPYAIKGDFDSKYLNLPEELITITMETHQRYFPIKTNDGKLTNHFVVIRNAPVYSEKVKLGNEKVIEPRLADSKFFFDEDLKADMRKWNEKLQNVMFQKDMGTISDKLSRNKKIASYLGANKDCLRAIELCKADLVSNVINEKEFTGLQGMMGEIYAKNSGENEIVSKAIREHYLPRFQGDDLPSSIEGSIASIADKLDTGIGAFCVGLKPTGSKDPYAIRRAIQGMVLIALNEKLDINYEDLSQKAYEIFSENKKVLVDNVLDDFNIFVKQRLEKVLQTDYPKDLIPYITGVEKNFKNIVEKLEKLNKISNTVEFNELINLLKRMKNITKDSNVKEINKDLLKDNYELAMYDLYEKLKNKEFSDIVDTLIENADVINSYFDNVKINVDDINVKNNRLAILNNILEICENVIAL